MLKKLWNIQEWKVAAIIFVLFMLYSFPLMQSWNSQTIGLYTAFADTPQILSNFYLLETSIEAGHPFYTNELFVPFGGSTAMHALIPIMTGLHFLTGGNVIAFLNTFLLISFLLAGIGAFRLAKTFAPEGKEHAFWGPLLVAFLYTYSTFRLAQWQDHIWYVVNFVPPWYFLWFRKIFHFKPIKIVSWKALIICFLLGVVSLSLEFYNTIFMVYLSIGYLVLKLLPSPIPKNWKTWKKGTSVAVVVILISQLVDWLQRSGWDDHHGLYWSGDLAGLIVPYTSRFYAFLFADGLPAWTGPNPDEKVMFLGFAFILALIPAKLMFWNKGRDPQAGKLFWYTTILLVLCFPVLKVFGHTLLKLPSALIHYVPFFNNVRVPSRWIVMVLLFAGLFLYRIYAVHWSVKKGERVFLILFLVLVFEYWPKSYALFLDDVNTAKIELIKQETGEVVMPIPFGVRDGYRMIGEQDNRYLYEQTLYRKKLLGGYLSRVDSTVFDAYLADPLCRDLFKMMENPNEMSSSQSDYSGFFKAFHPNLIELREDYQYSEVWRVFKQACANNQVKLTDLGLGVYRLEYSNLN